MRKRILAIILGLVTAVCGFAGCVNNSGKHSEDEVHIKIWSSGTGVQFLINAVEAFNAKNTGYTVKYEDSSNNKTIVSDFGKEDIDNTDIWMYSIDGIPTLISKYAEPLNDVLDTTYEGESKTIKDKFEKNFLNELVYEDGNYYSLSYGGGWYGIVYNQEIIDGVTFSVPRTTIELEALVVALYESKDVNMKPWISFKDEGYWNHMLGVWQAQYDTLDYVNNTFWKLDGGAEDPAPSKNVFIKEDGRYEALKALERIMKPDYIVDGSNSNTHTTSQTRFLHDEAVMMLNGSWLLNEMRNTSGAKDKFVMMKSPVISSIVEKCPTIDGYDGGEPDEELAALIDAVDAVASANDVPLTGEGYEVSREDATMVYNARNLMATNFDAHGIIIPKYATSKAGAKEFLKYFYSDENLESYWRTTQLPMMINYSNGEGPDMKDWNEWSVSQQKFSATAIPVYTLKRNCSPIFTIGGATPYGTQTLMKNVTSRGEYKDAATTWSEIVKEINSQWENYKTNAQL